MSECDTITDFLAFCTAELRRHLAEAGVKNPELYEVAMALPGPEEAPVVRTATHREAVRYIADVMGVPMHMFGVVEHEEAAGGQ